MPGLASRMGKNGRGQAQLTSVGFDAYKREFSLIAAKARRWPFFLAGIPAAGIPGTVHVTHGPGECPLSTRLRTPTSEAPATAPGRYVELHIAATM